MREARPWKAPMGQPLNVLPQCQACRAREQCLSGGLPGAQAERFARIHHLHQYRARQPIFHEGTPVLGFHIGCTGRVKRSKADR